MVLQQWAQLGLALLFWACCAAGRVGVLAEAAQSAETERRRYEPRPQARTTTREHCEDIFTRKDESPAPWPPPREIPAHLLKGFTMNGRVPVVSKYIAEKQNGGNGYVWSKQEIERTRADIRRKAYPRVGNSWLCYNKTVCAEALDKFSVAGQRGIVFGSQKPWAEALLLEHGASSVFTYEYMAIETDHPQLSAGTPSAVATQYMDTPDFPRYDFGFSFSSFEHDGLGRYGDPLNPHGDVLSIAKAACLIKPGGLFFLGLPVGPDAVVFNAHRIYGRARLPLILSHFELLEMVGNYSISGAPVGTQTQPVLVLRNRRGRDKGRLRG